MTWDNFRYFVDLSSNNARVGAASFNAAEYAAAGHVTVAIKVSQGDSYINPYWRQWAKDAHEAHLSLVLYHYGDNTASPAAQATHFATVLHASGLFLPAHDAVALDLEQGESPTDPVVFRSMFETATRRAGLNGLVLYSDAGYMNTYGIGLRPAQGGRAWVADISNGPLPAGWFGPSPWARQYTWTGQVKGVTGPVDLNRMAWMPALWRKLHRP